MNIQTLYHSGPQPGNVALLVAQWTLEVQVSLDICWGKGVRFRDISNLRMGYITANLFVNYNKLVFSSIVSLFSCSRIIKNVNNKAVCNVKFWHSCLFFVNFCQRWRQIVQQVRKGSVIKKVEKHCILNFQTRHDFELSHSKHNKLLGVSLLLNASS